MPTMSCFWSPLFSTASAAKNIGSEVYQTLQNLQWRHQREMAETNVPHPGHHTYKPFTGSWQRKHNPIRRRQLLQIRRALERDEGNASVSVLRLLIFSSCNITFPQWGHDSCILRQQSIWEIKNEIPFVVLNEKHEHSNILRCRLLIQGIDDGVATMLDDICGIGE